MSMSLKEKFQSKNTENEIRTLHCLANHIRKEDGELISCSGCIEYGLCMRIWRLVKNEIER